MKTDAIFDSTQTTETSVAWLRDHFLADHRNLESMIAYVIGVLSSDDREQIASLWDGFNARLAAHLEAEERLLFPALAQGHQGEAEALLREHEAIRVRLAQLDADVDLHIVRVSAVREFVDELQAHSAREDAILRRLASTQVPYAGSRSVSSQ
jgi:iron-sulfur cluster repair protein YtfE (RIC family)